MVSDLVLLSQLVQNVAIGVAVLIGGAWSLYIFLVQRANQTALEIQTVTTCSPDEQGNNVVFIDTMLHNKGTRVLEAMPKKYVKGQSVPTYQDTWEVLYQSCGLRIKSLATTCTEGTVFDWYVEASFKPIENLPEEINLLNGYEISKRGKVDFWMEPQESYHLSIAVLLPSGNYLGRVTFLGKRGDPDEFWSHEFSFSIPSLHAGTGMPVTGSFTATSES